MTHVNIQPPGVFTQSGKDRMPVIKVISGDTWDITFNLYDPLNPSEMATPSNTIVEAAIAETQFDSPIWVGEWHCGVTADKVRPDLLHLKIPGYVTSSLRRGSYVFSVKVSDKLRSKIVTEAEGSLLVEYKPTSPNHSIPYKDGEES